MRILSRYLLARFSLFFVATFIAATGFVVVVELLLNLDRMAPFEPDPQRAGSGPSPGAIALYLLLRLPSEYLSYLVPLSSFVAAFLCVAVAGHWRETLAAKAGGLPLRAICGPLMFAGLVLALLSLAAAEAIVVPASRAWLARKYGDDLSFSSGSVWLRRGARIYNVAEADPSARELRGLSVFERDEGGRLLRAVHAARAELESDTRWRLRQVTVRSFDERAAADAPLTEQLGELWLDVSTGDDAVLYTKNLNGLSLARLSRWVSSREARGRSSQAARTVMHGRVASASAAFVLVCLALPFALRVESGQGIGRSAVGACIAVVVYYALTSIAAVVAAEGVIPAAVGAWAPLGFFLFVASIGLARSPR